MTSNHKYAINETLEQQAHRHHEQFVIKTDNLTMQYGGQTVLDVPSELTISTGMTAIIGESGSGKSTLLNIIAGFTKPTTGAVTHFNSDYRGEFVNHAPKNGIFKATSKFLAQSILVTTFSEHKEDKYRSSNTSYVNQSVSLPQHLTGMQYLKLGHGMRGHKIDLAKSDELIEYFSMAGRMNRTPDKLSGGEQQRISIISAILSDSSLNFADEPTSALDPVNTERTLELFRREADKGKTFLVVSHDSKVADFANRVITMSDGRIVGDVEDQ